MKYDPEKVLNRLVVVALTIFVVVLMLLAALVLRQLWLQQRVADLSVEVQLSLEDLEETADEIQQELTEVRTASDATAEVKNWEEITQALDEVRQQLDTIDEDLNEVALTLDAETTVKATEDDAEPEVIQDQADEVFTIFAVLISLASIFIAVLLGYAITVQQRST